MNRSTSRRLAARPTAALLAVVLLAAAGCGTVLTGPAGFDFVRDEADLLDDDLETQVEEQLRSIATRTGVYGIVLAVAELPDPPTRYSPILAEVTARSGHGLIGLCLPDQCDLQSPAANHTTLAESLAMVAPAPEPAPGQGVPAGAKGLRAWVELVGAVATLDAGR